MTVGAALGLMVEDEAGGQVGTSSEQKELVQTAATWMPGEEKMSGRWNTADLSFEAHPGHRYRAWVWANLWGSQSRAVDLPVARVSASLYLTLREFYVRLA
jgi:hypothetical protein